MSILIKGMGMPKNCAECPCRTIGYTKDYCNVLGKFIDFVVGSEGRREDCPLIEVPPHGDLIDINALKLAILDVDYVNERDYLKWVLNAINHAPTVIEADKDGESG